MTLQASIGMSRVHSVPNLAGALDKITEGGSPDVIVLDLKLPDVNGLEGLVRLRQAVKAPIIVVSSLADDKVISSVIHAGASGFIPKHSQCDVFQAAFDTIGSGGRFMPPGYTLLEKAEDDHFYDALTRLASLTNQQSRIQQLICQGKANKRIAYELSIAAPSSSAGRICKQRSARRPGSAIHLVRGKKALWKIRTDALEDGCQKSGTSRQSQIMN